MGSIVLKQKVFSLAVLLLLWSCLISSASQSVSLAWAPDTSGTMPAGYFLYWGTTSGSYAHKIDVGTNTSYTLTGLTEGKTYYYAASSYSASGIESTLTPEISYLAPCGLTLCMTNILGVKSAKVSFSVAPSGYYLLQSSTNLVNWVNCYVTPVQSTNGWISFIEPCNMKLKSKFYRITPNLTPLLASSMTMSMTNVLGVASIDVRFSVSPATSYTLQSSTNLANPAGWSNIWVTPVQTTNGWLDYIEPITKGVSGKFFRAIATQ